MPADGNTARTTWPENAVWGSNTRRPANRCTAWSIVLHTMQAEDEDEDEEHDEDEDEDKDERATAAAATSAAATTATGAATAAATATATATATTTSSRQPPLSSRSSGDLVSLSRLH